MRYTPAEIARKALLTRYSFLHGEVHQIIKRIPTEVFVRNELKRHNALKDGTTSLSDVLKIKTNMETRMKEGKERGKEYRKKNKTIRSFSAHTVMKKRLLIDPITWQWIGTREGVKEQLALLLSTSFTKQKKVKRKAIEMLNHFAREKYIQIYQEEPPELSPYIPPPTKPRTKTLPPTDQLTPPTYTTPQLPDIYTQYK